jgi:hypothetical protein
MVSFPLTALGGTVFRMTFDGQPIGNGIVPCSVRMTDSAEPEDEKAWLAIFGLLEVFARLGTVESARAS